MQEESISEEKKAVELENVGDIKEPNMTKAFSAIVQADQSALDPTGSEEVQKMFLEKLMQ